MVVPNNHRFSYKNDHFGVFWGYHHFRKHPYTPNLAIASTLSLVFLHFYHQNYIVSSLDKWFQHASTHLQKTYSAEIAIPKKQKECQQIHLQYCSWKKSCTSWYIASPKIDRVLHPNGGFSRRISEASTTSNMQQPKLVTFLFLTKMPHPASTESLDM